MIPALRPMRRGTVISVTIPTEGLEATSTPRPPTPPDAADRPRPDGRRVRRHPGDLHAEARDRPRSRPRGDHRAPRRRRRRDRGGLPFPTGHSAAATWRRFAGPCRPRRRGGRSLSPSAARRRTAPTNSPTVRCLVVGCAATVVGLGVDEINRRFATACAAAGLEFRRTLQRRPRPSRRGAHRARGPHPRHPARRPVQRRGRHCQLVEGNRALAP